MKRNNKLLIVAMGAILAIIMNSCNSGKMEEEYEVELTEHRKKKNVFFQTDPGSPFASDSSKFKGLRYYAPNMDYKIQAAFTPITDKKIRTLPTSDGLKKQYLEYGYVEFELENKSNQLIILEMVGNGFDGVLFLAFGDATSALETYGAGRYLEVEHDGGKFITLDFNYAYNPYCAYSEGFSCPFPPKENLLDVSIEVGEKNYE